MSEYIFEIGLFCFGLTLIGILLTIREFRAVERRAKQREIDRRADQGTQVDAPSPSNVRHIRSA